MRDARRNKTIRYRAGILCLLIGLSMVAVIAQAQTGDTVRVGDTIRADQENTNSITPSDKESAQSDKGAAGLPLDTTSPAEPIFRSVPDSVAARWRKDPDFAYANDPAYWQQEHQDESPGQTSRFFDSKFFRYFVWILIGSLLLFVIIWIIKDNNMRLFYRSPRYKGGAAIQEEQSDKVEDDLEGQLQHFLQIRDHRQAVRYLYLKSLRLLHDRGLIRLHGQSTNREYLAQLDSDPHRAPFSNLTIAYEKVWYGEFPLSDGQFDRLHRYFEDFYKTVRS